jgi:ribonuclease BN (tRNA processing enzyme)
MQMGALGDLIGTIHFQASDGSAYVLDCGMGVTDQYARTGIPFSALQSIFITHHHADHNIEYGPLLIVGWIQGLVSTVAPSVRRHSSR